MGAKEEIFDNAGRCQSLGESLCLTSFSSPYESMRVNWIQELKQYYTLSDKYTSSLFTHGLLPDTSPPHKTGSRLVVHCIQKKKYRKKKSFLI